jgi:microcystin-dependent protein
MPYLTAGEVPDTTVCRALFIPNTIQHLANVVGALQELTFEYNFSQIEPTDLTAAEMAASYLPMFDAFCFNEGACRVIGEIIAYAGTTSPDTRWLVCDGSSLLRTDYPDLFDVIDVVYGSADSTHFNIPDLRGRAPIGSGSGTGLTPRTAGDSFGEETHVLTIGELAAHVHDTGNSALLGTSAPPPFDALGPNPFPAVTGSTGSDDPHNNMQPSLAINYLIVALS